MKLLGAHTSAAGGLDQAVERAVALGANCLQFFSGSPRVWARKPLAEIDLESLFAKVAEKQFGPIFTHALYLVNLASDKPEQLTKSINGLIYDLSFDSAVHGGGVVVHLGSHQGRGWLAVRDQVVRAIADILAATPDDSTFLIENSAGQAGKLASDLADIRWLLDQLQSNRVGWCMDTCHAFAAGYSLGQDLVAGTSSAKHIFDQTLATAITHQVLWSDLKLIHVNDSRDPFGSGRDRHANLGDGLIPAADLAYFLTLPQVEQLPLIMEVPGLDGKGPDEENLIRLKRLVGAG